ncbi:MAG: hypothetical protein JW957_06325 [Candidatus Omnitrophica bacterium]|nr:hypothetical protein [Candidatus Omnitrophota bacterium]
MNILKLGEEKIRKMTVWDMALVKLICVFLGLILGAYAAAFIKENILLFVILFIIGYITAIYRVLVRK